MHVCKHVYVCVQASMCASKHVYVCKYVCVRERECVCLFVYVCVRVSSFSHRVTLYLYNIIPTSHNNDMLK